MNILDLGFLSRFRRIILLGEFNSHHTMWGGRSINPSGRSLGSLIETNDYVVLNTSVPTHFTLIGPYVWNILDLTVASSSIASQCSVSITDEFLGSDHAIIHVMVHGVVPDITEPLPKWNFSRANWTKFHQLCSSSLNCISLDLEHSYQLLKTSILEAARAAIPQTKYTGKISVPWWNATCDLVIKTKKICSKPPEANKDANRRPNLQTLPCQGQESYLGSKTIILGKFLQCIDISFKALYSLECD